MLCDRCIGSRRMLYNRCTAIRHMHHSELLDSIAYVNHLACNCSGLRGVFTQAFARQDMTDFNIGIDTCGNHHPKFGMWKSHPKCVRSLFNLQPGRSCSGSARYGIDEAMMLKIPILLDLVFPALFESC